MSLNIVQNIWFLPEYFNQTTIWTETRFAASGLVSSKMFRSHSLHHNNPSKIFPSSFETVVPCNLCKH
ncbi:hypothetical protein QQP08_016981, partial [Theobroma cacao]